MSSHPSQVRMNAFYATGRQIRAAAAEIGGWHSASVSERSR